MDRLWQELRRRHVVRAGVVYALVAWLLAQVADLVLDNFNAPKWMMQSFLYLLIAGFPVALVIAWAFELTPRGFRRELPASTTSEAKDHALTTTSTLLTYAVWAGAVAGLAVIILLSARFAEQQRRAPGEAVDQRVVVAVFDNGTGNSALDSIGRMTADMISQGLQRTGIVDVVPPNTALFISQSIAGQGDTASDPVAQLAQDTGATYAVAGTFYRDADAIVFHAQIIDTRNADRSHLQVALEPVSAPYDRPGEAIEALRQRVMGAIASIIDPRIEQPAELMGHLPNYAAYRAFIEGLEIFWRSDFAGSRQHFERAIELDPNYHMPRILLIFLYQNINEWAESATLISELERRRGELSPYESYRLDQLVAAAEGDLQATYHAARQASSISPEFGPVHDGAVYAIALNRPQEGIEALQTIDRRRVLIGWSQYWEYLTAARHMLGDYEGELADALLARAEYPDSPQLVFAEIRARAALGDIDGVEKLIEIGLRWRMRARWTLGWLLRATGEELIVHGQADAGGKTLARAITWYQALPSPEKETQRYYLGLSLLSADRIDEAIALFEVLDREHPDQFFVLGALGVARALHGDRADAERISARLEAMNLPHSFGGISTWQAQIAASLGNGNQAIAFLQQAFSEGTWHTEWIHTRPAFRPLLDYPPFQALLQPSG